MPVLTYQIDTAKLIFAADNGESRVFEAFSGNGKGKDNIFAQGCKNTGPLPIGLYDMEFWPHKFTTGGGSFYLTDHDVPLNRLLKSPRNELFIHGGTKSYGCIVLSYSDMKELIATVKPYKGLRLSVSCQAVEEGRISLKELNEACLYAAKHGLE